MQRLIQRLRPHLQRRPTSLRAQGIESLESYKPLYDRKPPWWARFTYVLVCADLVMTLSATELTWNHWTREEPIPDTQEPTKAVSRSPRVPKDAPPEQPTKNYSLRPIYQRAPFAMAQLFLGVAFAVVLLGGRSRIVRRAYILPPTAVNSKNASVVLPKHAKEEGPNNRYVVLQGVHHFRRQGNVFPVRACTLHRSAGVDNEILIHADGVRGDFALGFDNVKINGRQMTSRNARQAFFSNWYDKKDAQKAMLMDGWTDGPIIDE